MLRFNVTFGWIFLFLLKWLTYKIKHKNQRNKKMNQEQHWTSRSLSGSFSQKKEFINDLQRNCLYPVTGRLHTKWQYIKTKLRATCISCFDVVCISKMKKIYHFDYLTAWAWCCLASMARYLCCPPLGQYPAMLTIW